MSERSVVLDEPVIDEQSEELRRATERAERAEAELAKLKKGAAETSSEARRTESASEQLSARFA